MLIGVRRKRVINRVRDFLLSRLGDDDVHYVQVGANDGQLDDPVYKIAEAHNWSALLIEPNPNHFSALSQLYADNPNFTLVNCGVSDQEGEMLLYHLSSSAEDKYSAWAKGCGTLDRERLEIELSGVTPPLENDIASTTVTLRTLDAILDTARVTNTDLLVIDVKGHEQAVLQSVDLGALRPRAVLIESNSTDPDQDLAIRAHVRECGYIVHRLGDDLFGYNDDFPRINPTDMLALIAFERLE